MRRTALVAGILSAMLLASAVGADSLDDRLAAVRGLLHAGKREEAAYPSPYA
jgi:hypothetical protein